MKTALASQLDKKCYSMPTENILTPTLVIYRNLVKHNIARIVSLLDGDPTRWRPHLKTVKLQSMTRLLVDAGVTSAKCATTLELVMACQAGMQDVLVAYPHNGENARRVAEIAGEFPEVRISAIVESEKQLQEWKDTAVELFIDIDAGMNRTGIDRSHCRPIEQLADAIRAAGLRFRGLHFYDGNTAESDLTERTKRAHERYGDLLAIVAAMDTKGISIGEVVTSGTPALPCSLSYPPLWKGSFVHRVSPGTVVYNDASSLDQLPEAYGLAPAVAVVTRIISHPKPGIATCDAGHKSVSVDSGVPNCVTLGYPELRALKPSEEHLPFEVEGALDGPAIGTVLYLIPRHVCPTVNNFDRAAVVEHGEVIGVEPVTARGREGPFEA
jgi:D-serine deaminase-like pyridoxal phosphate-dependent protein